uniref:Uncharacterized protein n=1 Tax=Leishmania guyanensis TaxID=5670 RepID=A0A1E1JAB9_LEIGU|nr:Hypothetical protein BN36_NA76540 [Leishmania guyanensis]CCM20189.1 Hypothetical protein BN36_NA76880 [Leishmania guyanensis]
MGVFRFSALVCLPSLLFYPSSFCLFLFACIGCEETQVFWPSLSPLLSIHQSLFLSSHRGHMFGSFYFIIFFLLRPVIIVTCFSGGFLSFFSFRYVGSLSSVLGHLLIFIRLCVHLVLFCFIIIIKFLQLRVRVLQFSF